MTQQKMPQTYEELIEILTEMGVGKIHFEDERWIHDATPEDYQIVLDTIRGVIKQQAAKLN